MAKQINEGNFVKWAVSGGWGFGKVLGLDDKNVSVELPTGATTEISVASANVINDKTYQKAVKDLIKVLDGTTADTDEDDTDAGTDPEMCKTKGKGKKMATNSDTNVASEVDAIKAKLTEVEATLVKANESIKTLTAEKAASDKALADSKAELDKIAKAARGESRFAEIKAFEADAAIAGKDDAERKVALAAMSDEVYAIVKNSAEAFKKVTDQAKSKFPKSTDQTVSDKPKSTDQTVTAADKEDKKDKGKDEDTEKASKAVADATAEKVVNAGAIATAAKGPSSFAEAMGRAIGRKEKVK